MGIDGLLALLKPVIQKEHLTNFRNKRVAVDAKAWLYKGCYGYTFELNQQVDTNDFMYYVMQMVQLLRHYSIDPILVFDGRSLSMKGETNDKRRKIKEDNHQKGLKSLENEQYTQAQKHFSRCIKIDEKIFSTALNCLRSYDVKFMVAPYEADSEIAKLYQMGEIDLAITEDSDFLVYGCKVILKLNQSGDCDYVDLDSVDPQKHKSDQHMYSFLTMGTVDRIQACVLAGCDYLSNVRGVGLKTAISLIKKHTDLDEVISSMRGNKSMKDKIPQGYEKNVRLAQLIFLLAKIYNPQTKSLEYLKDQAQFNELKLPKEQLDQVVGLDYDYTQLVRLGYVQCNSFKQRQIVKINFKSFFLVDKNNLALQELRYRMHNKEQIKFQEFYTKEQLEVAAELDRLQQIKVQQENKQKQEDAKIRHSKFNGFLNSLMSFGDQQAEGQEKEEPSIVIEMSPEDEDSLPYSNLNPFIIKDR